MPQFTVVTGALVIAVGTVVLASPLCSTDDVGLWQALFTVTSAITVTGLSIIDVSRDLTAFGQVTLAGLIVTGGLGLMAITTFLQGFVQGHSGLRHRLDRGRALDEFGVGGIGWRVINDLWTNRARLQGLRRLSLHTRLVLRSTALLIVLGALGLLFTEQFAAGGVIDNLQWWQDIQVTLFQSISARTAGFNTVPLSIQTFSDAGLLLLVVLMFIGASPGGTGGGIKTTTFATLMGATRSTLQGREEVVIHRRQIPDTVVLRAVGVALASAIFVILMALLLGIGPTTSGEPTRTSFNFLEKLFTCMSAFGTVGLDLGVTAQLNRWGQLVLMVGMFVGRLGILLLLSAIYGNRPQPRVGYPREEIYI